MDSDPGKRICLITGAAGGLGKAMALEFARHGWRVIATDIDAQALKALAGVQGICPRVMDVTSDTSVKQLFLEVSGTFGSLNMIINNAGIDRYFPFSEAPVEAFMDIFGINLFGAYRVNRIFLPIIESPGGRILHISSESHHLTLPFMPYPLTKKALESYSKVLRQELGFRGIDVVAVRPGPIMTRFISDLSGIRFRVSDPGLAGAFRRFAETAPRSVGKIISPEAAAGKVYRISCIRNPRPVYRINNSLKLRLVSLLPFRIIEKGVGRKLS